jgi:NSS family neurotransmitter:Na+ symporter
MDVRNVERKKAVKWNFVAVVILSLPCALGFNVLSGFEPFGPGSCVLDLEDFLVSNTLLPLGSLVFVLFCNSRYGWGQFKFIAEANLGVGMKFPKLKILHLYFKWILPIIIMVILVFGYLQKFAPSLYNKIFE